VRILQAAVIVMGVLIFVGLGVLVWGLFDLSSKDGAAPAIGARPPATAPGGFDRVSLGLPAGCEIADAAAADGRLVVRTSCGELRVLDLATGAPLGTVTR
jgi:hypothetical protein